MNSSNLYYPISGLINAFTSIILGIFVLSRNKTNVKHITYALFCLSIAVWSSFYFAWLTTDNSDFALIYSRGFMAGAIFIPIFYLHHICSLLNQIYKRKKIIVIAYLLGIIALILDFTPYYIPNVKSRLSFKFWPSASPLFTIFLIIWSLIVIYGAYLIWVSYKKAYGLEKNRLKYVLIATVIGWGGGATNYPLWYDMRVLPFLNILVSAYIVIVGYAILRHQLMDIEVIIRRAAVFAGLLASVFAMLVLPTLIIQEYLFRGAGTGGRLLGLTISGVIIILTVRRIENALINLTDKFLFQKKYDYKELLKTFTGEVLTVLDLSKLVNVTTENLSKIIRLESCAVLIHDKDKDNYPISASLGLKEPSQVFAKNTHIINYLLKTHHYLLKNKTITDLPDTGTVKEDLKKLNAELVIPIVLHDDLMGALTLGRKKSGEDFTQDDLDILLPLSQTLAVAISNAQYFFELSKTQQEAAQREKMAVIGTLAAGINHEICNPLGIARGQSEAFLLNKRDGIFDGKPESEQLKEATDILQLVITEVDRATAITKKLSTFAKPSKGEISDDVDIAKEVDEVLALIGYELRLDKIEFVKNVPTALPHIRADKKQIQEILFNLIRNAAQAISESGKITVSARVAGGDTFQNSGEDVSGKVSPSVVVIDITDTGCGIPEDKLGMIFNPFYTTKEPGKGTGLGLFIVRQVVERNKGKISLKSKVGEGTTFTLEFPVSS